jgi:RNA-splicing ligase RtcB
LTQKEVIIRKNKLLKRVLYKIPDGMDFKERLSMDKSDMLTVVVEISVCDHIKVIFIHY